MRPPPGMISLLTARTRPTYGHFGSLWANLSTADTAPIPGPRACLVGPFCAMSAYR